jgi:hypothetical protein
MMPGKRETGKMLGMEVCDILKIPKSLNLCESVERGKG